MNPAPSDLTAQRCAELTLQRATQRAAALLLRQAWRQHQPAPPLPSGDEARLWPTGEAELFVAFERTVAADDGVRLIALQTLGQEDRHLLILAELRAAALVLLPRSAGPAALLGQLNGLLSEMVNEPVAAAWVGHWKPQAGNLTWASAGWSGLRLRPPAGAWQRPAGAGPLLGLIAAPGYGDQTSAFSSGAALFLGGLELVADDVFSLDTWLRCQAQASPTSLVVSLGEAWQQSHVDEAPPLAWVLRAGGAPSATPR